MRIKKWIVSKLSTFKQSRFFLGLVCLVIGATGTYLYLVGVPYYNWANEGYRYTLRIHTVEAEVEPQVGEVVSQDTGSLPKDSKTISSREGITDLVALYFGDDTPTALAVAKCESSLIADRIGDTHLSKPSVGLFQISQIYHDYTTEQLQDPEFNVKVAKEIYDKGGWGRWTCYRTGQYLANL